MAACGWRRLHEVTDGVHQVGLAHADAAIQEERVVGLGGAFGDGLRRSVRELIAAADDKAIELVARVELRGGSSSRSVTAPDPVRPARIASPGA